MPPVQSTTLQAFQLEEIVKYWEESQAKLIKAAHTELHSVIDIYSIPSFQQLEYVIIQSPLEWNAIENLLRYTIKPMNLIPNNVLQFKVVLMQSINTYLLKPHS